MYDSFLPVTQATLAQPSIPSGVLLLCTIQIHALLAYLVAVSASECWGVNGHTTRCGVIMLLQCKLVKLLKINCWLLLLCPYQLLINVV